MSANPRHGWFGFSCLGLGDLDKDGTPDLAVSSLFSKGTSPNCSNSSQTTDVNIAIPNDLALSGLAL